VDIRCPGVSGDVGKQASGGVALGGALPAECDRSREHLAKGAVRGHPGLQHVGQIGHR